MKNKSKIFLIILLLNCFTFPQPNANFKPMPFEIGFYSEYHLIPNDTANTFYFLFNIQNRFLVFEKSGNDYTALFRITVEVFDSSKKFVTREIIEKKVITQKFDETISNNKLNELLVKVNLASGKYSIHPQFTDVNSKRDFVLKNININTKELNNNFCLQPIVTLSAKTDCLNAEFIKLVNKEGNIPFNSNSYDLILPVLDTSISKINVVIKIDSNEIKFEGEDFFYSYISLKDCSGNILIDNDGKVKTKNFIIKNINAHLQEGLVNIKISSSADSSKKIFFLKESKWYNKPFSLINLENAIQYLSIVENENIVDSLQSKKNNELKKALFYYWKKNDPTAKTEFNELMEEFYQRIDYANLNFSAINFKQGAFTDRGKTFIKYGHPSKIERTTNKNGKVVEIWIYSKLDKQFIFVDKLGTGKFELTNVL